MQTHVRLVEGSGVGEINHQLKRLLRAVLE